MQMRKKSKIILAVLTLFFIFSSVTAEVQAAAMLPASYKEAATWLDKTNGDKLILTPEAISAYNKKLQEDNPAVLVDLANYPLTLAGTSLKAYLAEAAVDEALFVQQKPLTPEFIAALQEDCNAAEIAQNVSVKYGIVVARTNLRAFPTLASAFEEPGDYDFDMWQETAVDPSELVVILHQNKKKNFVYVQMRNYRGWLPLNKIGVTDRTTWQKYFQSPTFAVVAARLLPITVGEQQWLYQMGAKLPAKAEPVSNQVTLLLPLRDAKGHLQTKEAPYTLGSELSYGYLPYTANVLVQQAFKHLGHPYGWGGLKNEVDCSALVANVYRSVGIELPRNADEQEVIAGNYKAEDLTDEQKLMVLKELPAGAFLGWPSHIMLYLGQREGKAYAIHAFSKYMQRNAQGALEPVPVFKVAVTDLDILRANGQSFLANVETIGLPE